MIRFIHPGLDFFTHFIASQSIFIWSYLLALIIIFTLLENRSPIRQTRKVSQSLKEEYGFVIGNKLLSFVLFGLATNCYSNLNFKGILPITALPIIIQFVILLVTFEFLYYFFHRALHKYKFLWNFHQVHHSIEDINAVNGNLRYHILEEALETFIVFVPLLKMGFSSEAIMYRLLLQLLINTCAHCNFAFNYGFINKWLVTTQVHQLHHDGVKEVTVNYGNITPVFDRLFGTFSQPEPNVYPDRLGLWNEIVNYPYPKKGYIKQQLYPFTKYIPILSLKRIRKT